MKNEHFFSFFIFLSLFFYAAAGAQPAEQTAAAIMDGQTQACTETTCGQSKMITSLCGLVIHKNFGTSGCAKKAVKKHGLNFAATAYAAADLSAETLKEHLMRKIKKERKTPGGEDEAAVQVICQKAQNPETGGILKDAQSGVIKACNETI